jgi:chaperone required for assembly of F1-ATPase
MFRLFSKTYSLHPIEGSLFEISNVKRSSINFFSTVDYKPSSATKEIKRFWKKIEITCSHNPKSYIINLDGKTLKHNSGDLILLPNYEMALLLATEWESINTITPQHVFPMVTYFYHPQLLFSYHFFLNLRQV